MLLIWSGETAVSRFDKDLKRIRSSRLISGLHYHLATFYANDIQTVRPGAVFANHSLERSLSNSPNFSLFL